MHLPRKRGNIILASLTFPSVQLSKLSQERDLQILFSSSGSFLRTLVLFLLHRAQIDFHQFSIFWPRLKTQPLTGWQPFIQAHHLWDLLISKLKYLLTFFYLGWHRNRQTNKLIRQINSLSSVRIVTVGDHPGSLAPDTAAVVFLPIKQHTLTYLD